MTTFFTLTAILLATWCGGAPRTTPASKTAAKVMAPAPQPISIKQELQPITELSCLVIAASPLRPSAALYLVAPQLPVPLKVTKAPPAAAPKACPLCTGHGLPAGMMGRPSSMMRRTPSSSVPRQSNARPLPSASPSAALAK